MNSMSARIVVAAVCVTGVSTCAVSARSYSLESLSCLFDLAKASKPTLVVRPISFSFVPLSEEIALHRQHRSPGQITTTVEAATAESQPDQPMTEFSTTFNDAPRVAATAPAPPAADGMDSWPLFEALHHWRNNPQIQGLSRNLRDSSSFVALDYSDIFETGRATYKGGHGPSIFFRHTF